MKKNTKREARKITRKKDLDKSYNHHLESKNSYRDINRTHNFFCKSFFESFLFL